MPLTCPKTSVRGGPISRFVIAPGSVLAKRPPRWVMAAELVETDRLRARRVAAIQPEWAESIAEHLVKRSYGEPWWDDAQGRALVGETVTLYGLPIVANRTIGLDRVDHHAVFQHAGQGDRLDLRVPLQSGDPRREMPLRVDRTADGDQGAPGRAHDAHSSGHAPRPGSLGATLGDSAAGSGFCAGEKG